MKAQAGAVLLPYLLKFAGKVQLMLKIQPLWFGQLLLCPYSKGGVLEIHSSPDDTPGSQPNREIHRFENKQAGAD